LKLARPLTSTAKKLTNVAQVEARASHRLLLPPQIKALPTEHLDVIATALRELFQTPTSHEWQATLPDTCQTLSWHLPGQFLTEKWVCSCLLSVFRPGIVLRVWASAHSSLFSHC
jgi:hypothetical protein